MKNLLNFKWLLLSFILSIASINQVWAYKIYFCTEYFTDWKVSSAKPKLFVTGFDNDSEMTNISSNWWYCEVGEQTGSATIKRYSSDGKTLWNEFTVTGVDADHNIIYASSVSSGYKGSPREYDGETYIYWKIHDNNIPDFWDDDNIDQDIQLRKNDNSVTGYVTGEKVTDKIWRYLVPAGKYVNVELRRHNVGNYSGPFAFSSSSSYNMVWDFQENGHYANWSASYFANNAYIYMDNTTSEWSTESGYNHILIGRHGSETYSNTYHITPISNTKLLCYDGAFSFDNFDQLVFIHTTADDWGESNSESPGTRKEHAANHTDEVAYLMDGGSKLYNLFTPDGPGSSDYPVPSHSSASSYAGLLHSTQTVNTVVKITGSYASANSKAEITLGSYYLNSATTSTSSSATLTTSESTDNVTACKTATTTLTCSNTIADGYQFDGWYESANGDDQIEDDKTYAYATTGTTTVYARFSAIGYTITLDDNGGTGGDGTHSVTYDAAVGSLTNKPTKTNYVFCGYETSDHIKIFDADKAPVSNVSGYTDASGNWIKADDVELYAIWEDQWSICGNAGDDGVADAMGDWDAFNSLPFVSGTTYSGQITLDSKTTYSFKVVDRVNNAWYGKEETSFERGGSSVSGFESGKGATYNLSITTDAAGDYTFVWNSASTGTLLVTFPDAHTITFGIGAINGSNSDITATSTPSFTSGDYVLDATAVTFSKGTTKDGYKWEGWYSNNDGTGTCHSSTDGSWTSAASTRTANISVYACYSYKVYTINYYDEGEETYSGSNLASLPSTHTYNSATDLVDGTKAGYSFDGWYTTPECDDDPITSLGATAYLANIKLYAKWSPVELTFNPASGTDWGTASNWSPACVPTIEHDVVIKKPVVVGSTTAQAKSVKIDSKTGTGSLTIGAGYGLVVAESITENGGSTSSSSLSIGAGGALVWGTSSSTPGSATVGFLNSSYGEGGDDTSINQYIGTPFTGGSTSDYGSAWTYNIAYDGSGNPYWNEYSGSMSPFIGYNLISKEGTGVISLSGTLVSNTDQSITLSHGVENVLANSWIAPIRIGALQSTDFGGATASIYIFTATSPKALEKESGLFGNYDTYSVGPSSEEIIPSMQSFSVLGTGTLSLDYSKIVYDPAVEGLVTEACRAPRRVNSKRAEMVPLRIHVRGTNGWSDELKMYLHEDFSTDYENGWDAPKMYGFEEAPSLYAMNNEGEMAISCVPTADNQFVCFHAGTDDNEYTMTFVYDGDEELYLKDMKLNIDTQINSENSYHFAATTSDSDMRFIIHRAPAVVTGMEEVNTNGNVQKIMHNGALYIVREGKIYSIDGALVK